jgi:hypothetical protein
MKKHLMAIWKGQRPKIDMWHYIVGNYRYFFYYGGTLSRKSGIISWLRKQVLREYIKEQIAFRIHVMKQECYDNGECIMCGCSTTQLQMCAKTCDDNCYPPLLSKDNWYFFKRGVLMWSENNAYCWQYISTEFKIFRSKDDSLQLIKSIKCQITL